ncbi:MAG TPA: gamma-glutamyl-gamma-aminobutyrate hydrolase family protein [Ktedonobacteraceae bacterium]
MQKNSIHLTKEVENQQVQERRNEQIERELSDTELTQIKGAAGTPSHLYAADTPFMSAFQTERPKHESGDHPDHPIRTNLSEKEVMVMRPLIGIPYQTRIFSETNRPSRPIVFNNKSYIQAVEQAGGVPILLPLLDDLSGLQTLLPRLDGLLLSGGSDVDPQHYHEEAHPLLGETNPQFDALEIALAQWALQEDLPTLGICRGMQVLNVALGGNLYQDLNAQDPGSLRHPNWDLPRNKIIHSVRIERNSRLAKILDTHEIQVNSLHHQAVKESGRDVTVSGYAEDGVAELMEVPQHHFMLGAQCHPEELYQEHPNWKLLFTAFIQATISFSARTTIRPMEETEAHPMLPVVVSIPSGEMVGQR